MKPITSHEEELDTLTMERDGLLGDDQHDHELEDIALFARQNGLEHKLDILQEAAARIHNGGADAAYDPARSKWRQPIDLYLCVVATALGSMIQGWSQTGINGANIYYPKLFGIGPLTTGVVNCGIYLGNGLLGSWLVAPLNQRLGRRGAAFAGTLITLIFNVAGSAAYSWQILLACRLALGIGLGINNTTLNVFAAECSPAVIRGGLGVAWQMFCAFGIFLGFFTNMHVDSNPESYGPLRWRIMLLAAGIPAIPLLVIIFICPNSPAWIIKETGKYDRAYAALRRLRTTELEAAVDLLLIYSKRRQQTHDDSKRASIFRLLPELYTIPRLRRATLACYTTQLAQMLCGINIIAFYSSTIFVQADFSPYYAELASTIYGLVNWLGAFPAIWTMDTLGRRSLLLLTLPFMAVSMATAGMSFAIADAKLRFGLTAGMIYLFCLLYSPGMGPVPAAYTAEAFPSSHRELGASSAIAFANLLATVLSLTFPWLLDNLGTQGSFLLYAALNVVALVLVYLFVPETKQKTLEELDEVFAVPTRTFVKYQVKEYAPWWVKRYLLRRRNEVLKTNMLKGSGYQAIVSDDGG